MPEINIGIIRIGIVATNDIHGTFLGRPSTYEYKNNTTENYEKGGALLFKS